MTTHVDPSRDFGAWQDRQEPPMKIPLRHTPWFVALMLVFAVVMAVLTVVGFWMASGPNV
jgi:hypothetical protein